MSSKRYFKNLKLQNVYTLKLQTFKASKLQNLKTLKFENFKTSKYIKNQNFQKLPLLSKTFQIIHLFFWVFASFGLSPCFVF